MGDPIVVKLHGCSGAGKSTIARTILHHATEINIVEPSLGRHEAYVCYLPNFDRPLAILGSYQNVCGGMDTVPSQKEAIKLVNFYSKDCHVFHEGLLQSTYYGKMGQHSTAYGDRYIYAFLDTPIELCLKRIEERRAASQRRNKFNPQNTIDKWNTINRLLQRTKWLGHNVYVWDHNINPIPQVYSLYMKKGQ
jgi:predicted kinase